MWNRGIGGSGDASDLSFEDAALSTVISDAVISQAPQYQRSWDDLAGLVAAFKAIATPRQPGSPSSHKQGQFAVHGGRQDPEQLDAGPVSTTTRSPRIPSRDTQLVVRPSIDAVEEISLITSPYRAEYVEVQARRSPPTVKEVRIVFMVQFMNTRGIAQFDANTFFCQRAGSTNPGTIKSVRRHGGRPIVSNNYSG